MGAALAYWHRELDKPREDLKDKMKGAYLGPILKEDSIEKNLKSLKAVYTKKTSSEISKLIAKELANSKISRPKIRKNAERIKFENKI